MQPTVHVQHIDSNMNSFFDVNECIYVSPQRGCRQEVFYQIKEKSKQQEETFESIASFFENIRNDCHQFIFKYPIDSNEVEQFEKVLQIKAQEAHHFVPAISQCKFIQPRHLGFDRQIEIGNGGPIIDEIILVDKDHKMVIFIEDTIILPNGQELQGSFAALNAIVEDEKQWYFAGIYLYADKPDEEKIKERQDMFKLTHENMTTFLKSEDVDHIYENLQEF